MKLGDKGKSGYLQISFNWLFAIVVGMIILFLAIYAAIQMLRTGDVASDAKLGTEFGIILNPLETSFQSSTSTFIQMPTETRIINRCYDYPPFGSQVIQVSQKNFNKWSKTNVDVEFTNKYIFSEKEPEGKDFYVFSKPFDFPFKIADLIYLSSARDNYCFKGLNLVSNIKEEIEDINQSNFFLKDCPGESTEICFNELGCDISVNYGMGYVEKEGERSYFETDALMYAAIFSDKEVYDCQTKRLMQRAKELAVLYKSKAAFISGTGCNSNINNELDSFISVSGDLVTMGSFVEQIREGNYLANCKLW